MDPEAAKNLLMQTSVCLSNLCQKDIHIDSSKLPGTVFLSVGVTFGLS